MKPDKNLPDINSLDLIKAICQMTCGEHFFKCEHPCNIVQLIEKIAKEWANGKT